MITLTENAKLRFKQQLKDRGKGLGIRLGITKTGCSGYAYQIEFADEWRGADHLSIFDDLYIWITDDAYKYLDGMTVDYTKKGLNEKFEFINPNESGRCGCGESFTV
jgi:iron-sulfur cluster assembly protein